MKMYVGGKWIDKDDKIDVLNPYDGSVIDTVPRGDTSDVEAAIASAERGAAAMACSIRSTSSGSGGLVRSSNSDRSHDILSA